MPETIEKVHDALRDHVACCNLCGEIQLYSTFDKGCPNGCFPGNMPPPLKVTCITLMGYGFEVKNG